MDPDRLDGAGFAATEMVIDASPWPSCVATDTHVGTDDTDHVQSRVVFTFSMPLPPAGPNDAGVVDAVIGHLSAVGAVTEVVEEPQEADASSAATKIAAAAARAERKS